MESMTMLMATPRTAVLFTQAVKVRERNLTLGGLDDSDSSRWVWAMFLRAEPTDNRLSAAHTETKCRHRSLGRFKIFFKFHNLLRVKNTPRRVIL